MERALVQELCTVFFYFSVTHPVGYRGCSGRRRQFRGWQRTLHKGVTGFEEGGKVRKAGTRKCGASALIEQLSQVARYRMRWCR